MHKSRFFVPGIFLSLLFITLIVVIGNYAFASLTFDNTSATSDAGLTLSGATGSNITVGSATHTGTITLGNSTSGDTISIGNAVNTGAQVLNIANGASGADSTVNILGGVATTGTQTLNLGTGASAKTVNIGNTTGASTLNLLAGSGGIALDKGTLTVSGTGNTYTLNKTSGIVTYNAASTAINASAAVTVVINDDRIKSNSIIMPSYCSAQDAGVVFYSTYTTTNGSMTVSLWNVGGANQTHAFNLCFVVTN